MGDGSSVAAEALGLFIPLIVVNCIILGRAEAFAAKNSPVASLFDGIGIGLGFTLGLTVFAGMREQLELVKIPKGMQGMAIVMLSAGLLSLAFMGFSGVDGGLKLLFGLD